MLQRNFFLLVLLMFGGICAAQAANVGVTVGPNNSLSFSPAAVTINAGDSVTFTYGGGSMPHNVVSDTGLFRCAEGCDGSGGNGDATGNGWTSTVVFNTAGTFGYYCEIHGGPGGVGMSGKVIVAGTTPPPDFSIAPDTSTLSVAQGAAGNVGISITPLNGFNSTLTFAASGLPDGVTAAFTTNSATSATLNLTASNTAATGDSTLTITATAGSLVHTVLVTLTVTAATSTFLITPGITGTWYNPSESGQGFNFEVLAGNTMAAFWYVFDANGNNLWLSGIGSYSGDTATLDLIQTTGGLFPPNFDKTKIVRNPWGTLTLTFSDCSTATATWAPIDTTNFSNGTLAINRLTSVGGMACP